MAKPHRVTPTSGKIQNDIVILHQNLQHQRLINLNRYLILAIFVLMTMVFVLGFFVFPDNSDMAQTLKNKQQQAVAMKNSPAISAEIDSLKGELVGLVSGSIEAKLKSLEEGIKLGSVLSSLQTLQAIRNDVKVLHKYSDPLEQKQQQIAQANVALIEEVSHLKSLIYLTLGSCSLMFTGLLLIWARNRRYFLNNQKNSPSLLKSANISK